MLKFTIYGRPIVKKNTQKTVRFTNRWGKTFTKKIDSQAYRDWHNDALKQIIYGGEPIDYPINLQCEFYMPTNHRFDISNMYEGIQDTLVEKGVLDDDYFKIVAGHDGSRVFIDPDNPRMEITITRMENIND